MIIQALTYMMIIIVVFFIVTGLWINANNRAIHQTNKKIDNVLKRQNEIEKLVKENIKTIMQVISKDG